MKNRKWLLTGLLALGQAWGADIGMSEAREALLREIEADVVVTRLELGR